MPVPVPRRSSPPPRFARNQSPFSDIKKRQAAVAASLLQSPLQTATIKPVAATPVSMNGHADGEPYANGHANGAATVKQRRRHGRKRNRRASASSVTSFSSSSSLASTSTAPPNGLANGNEVHVRHGGDDVDADSKETRSRPRTPPVLQMPTRAEFEEWKGVMKKVVDEWEIPRKVLHSSIGFGVVYLYSQRPETVKPVIYALSASLSFIIPCDILRLNNDRFERLYEKVVGVLMRRSERNSTNGVIWYMLGVIYALALLPRDLAVMSILILSWCDTAASTFGRLYGRYTPALPQRIPVLNLPLAKKKSVAGSFAACLTGAITAALFWGYAVPAWQGYSQTAAEEWGPVSWKWADGPGVGIINGGPVSLGLMSLVVGLISAVTEALDLGTIDDNLSLPIISGTVLWGLSKLAAWFLDFRL